MDDIMCHAIETLTVALVSTADELGVGASTRCMQSVVLGMIEEIRNNRDDNNGMPM